MLGAGSRASQRRDQVEEIHRQLGRDHFGLVLLRPLSVSQPGGEHFAALAELSFLT